MASHNGRSHIHNERESGGEGFLPSHNSRSYIYERLEAISTTSVKLKGSVLLLAKNCVCFHGVTSCAFLVGAHASCNGMVWCSSLTGACECFNVLVS